MIKLAQRIDRALIKLAQRIEAFTPLSGITHHQKSKGCARICVTRGRRKVWRGAKPRQ
ncbi:hypothetical protein LTSEUGA_5243 [Salmonella enterica subsp. enterica serovar Uganda str. R8-3404]|uniref:Uncharacterized protein n=1 Tax=Salmonella enterica subsp. enterica serovar Uganda str. R8-3404 TaxID=913083 RepID=A0A6C8GWN9_SALET|nr:hypothetical protein LTSEUGA_5243 [Salmonella enterica subsp. enterica serovar Uganda str. R8-3404]